MRLVLLATASLWLLACAHGVTNEQRVDGATEAVVDSTADSAELRCRDTSPEVSIARDRAQKKSERLARYAWAVADAKATVARFDEAFRKDPDLVYGPEAGEWKRRQSFCNELVATLAKEQSRVELETEPVLAVEKPAVEKEKKAAPAKKAAVASAPASEEKETASAADEAFGDDADSLRTAYKKKAKVAKAKKHKKGKHVSLARR
jgi:hypothetical protein